jgi:hypothetical protein
MTESSSLWGPPRPQAIPMSMLKVGKDLAVPNPAQLLSHLHPGESCAYEYSIKLTRELPSIIYRDRNFS